MAKEMVFPESGSESGIDMATGRGDRTVAHSVTYTKEGRQEITEVRFDGRQPDPQPGHEPSEPDASVEPTQSDESGEPIGRPSSAPGASLQSLCAVRYSPSCCFGHGPFAFLSLVALSPRQRLLTLFARQWLKPFILRQRFVV